MDPIPMVDLKGQYAKIKAEVDAAILQVVESTQFINGPEVTSFASELEEYLKVEHVIPCGNGTDALQIALMALGLKPGDEVITSDFTFVATAEVIGLLQLTPVLVDVDPQTFCLDPEAVEKAITPRTRAIVPVHLFGQSAPMEALMQLARDKNIAVVEDNAQAIGADYIFGDRSRQKTGGIGHIGCTSFFPSKNLGCYGDGGAIFTQDDEIANNLRQIANHGQSKRYYHDQLGVNSRLDSVQAAVLRIKLRKLDEYGNARRAAADAYDAAFADNPHITAPFRAPYSTHVFHQYCVLTEGIDRDKLMHHLQDRSIACNIYYPVPLHRQKAYLDPRYREDMFPTTNDITDRILALPIHTELSGDTIERITDTINQFTK